ncbi:hypothetical protein C5Y96_19505 [Blastopirellula marina]|uniref:DUF4261 domain-containing protein n=2 Tax=Pirellulales TaxID=2691354 RepID=A0A2S8F4R6_9BACT|nr:hypothetical protein C5Y96_19505 [Blastopirellula marina]RCS46503.1 DUF4261 domain-containing protein [Bremerella cremea]
MMLAAAALLKCGGIAIKIESTGIAHPAKKWEEWSEKADLPTLFRAYVTYIGSGDLFYSCGMHNLGYPDCVVQAEIEPQTAAELIDAFLRYLLFDGPELEDGQTFSVKAEAPRYKIEHQKCTMFEPDHLFHNPYGVWKLAPAGKSVSREISTFMGRRTTQGTKKRAFHTLREFLFDSHL